ncbi:MAG: sn-glycerol-1-phosphate dehydrogenase [Bacteroidia bacterium]
MPNLREALAAASETKDLRIGWNILAEVVDLLNEQFPNRKTVIIADPTTYRVAGEAIFNLLESASIAQLPPFIYTDPYLYAEYTFVDQLVDFLSTNDAIPIAVGSGTINDLTKLAAHLCSRQYLCVATAASMDGYTAFGASITANGAKQTFNCPAPQACLADIAIISKAPKEMTAAGYADLFAKITAGADWILADRLKIEPIDDKAWSIVQGGLHHALSDPEGVRRGDSDAITKLVEGLMLGGFAMQWSKSSRPASGAEHQFSHLWNMENHLNKGEHISHGFQVSIGTLAITALYELLLETNVQELDVNLACEQWPDQTNADAIALKKFEGTDFPEIGLQETRAKYSTKIELSEQLNLLKTDWVQIKMQLQKQLLPLAESKRRLALVGAPTEPEQIGISREKLRETFISAQFIRRRYTILDLALRTGYFNQWLDKLFGKEGLWQIN